MPPLKIFTLTSLLALALAAPSAFAQTGDNTPPPPSNAPTISPTPGDATAAPANKQRGAKRRNTNTTKPAAATPAQ